MKPSVSKDRRRGWSGAAGGDAGGAGLVKPAVLTNWRRGCSGAAEAAIESSAGAAARGTPADYMRRQRDGGLGARGRGSDRGGGGGGFGFDPPGRGKGGRGRGLERDQPPWPPGYRRLLDWLQLDADELVTVLANSHNNFVLLLESELAGDRVGIAMQLLAKACQSTLEANKTTVLAAGCSARFQAALATFLHGGGVGGDGNGEWLDGVLTFCEVAAAALPVTAAESLTSTLAFLGRAIDAVPAAVDTTGLTQRLLTLHEAMQTRVAALAAAATQTGRRATGRSERLAVQPAPDDFRELSVIPTAAEITKPQRPFLRPNIVDGAYLTADHYLDVQFRLMREDFIEPLREGICALAAGNDGRRQTSVRVYKNVAFCGPALGHDRVGHRVRFPAIARVDWATSKRLMFGTLLCFTADNFVTVLFATVLERSPARLVRGEVAVEMEMPVGWETLLDRRYTMVESEVFFAPYNHVLQALQVMSVVPLARYIVEIQQGSRPPHYLANAPGFTYHIRDNDVVHQVRPLEGASWPDEMSLNESQREALMAALTREFVVIQGPPGTGKTHVGLVIARTLVVNALAVIQRNQCPLDEELFDEFVEINWPPRHYDCDDRDDDYEIVLVRMMQHASVSSSSGCAKSPLLVVCLTNHALDQFLEGLLHTTNRIVRVGGQSKSELLKDYNLKEWRNMYKMIHRHRGKHPLAHLQLGRDIRGKMSDLMNAMRGIRNDLNSIARLEGIISIKTLGRGLGTLNLDAFRNQSGELDDKLFLEWLESGEEALPEEEAVPEEEEPDVWFPAPDGVDEPDLDPPEDFDVENVAESVDFDVEMINSQEVFNVAESKLSYAVNFFEIGIMLVEIEDQIILADEKEMEVADTRSNLLLEAQGWFLRDQKRALTRRLDFFKRWLHAPVAPADVARAERLLARPTRLWDLSAGQRRGCYERWLRLLRRRLYNQLPELVVRFREEAARYDEVRTTTDLDIMRSALVVGMTTTMAAKMRPLLTLLRPKIVIVEEAAEATESHIVVALTEKCEQLILIGDHQQLRPSTATYRLAREFHLDVSLFERMVRNGLHCARLDVQHRMRPEIARLVAPPVYADLRNHASVEGREPVRGVRASVFFFTHNKREEQVTETSSKRNKFEGDLVLAFCRYLLQQGYPADKVTILATYSGQMFYMKEARKRIPMLADVAITIVDNFQGEENDIILLSLVRNNEENNIGFLSTENRVCVALSRARNGLFIFGNMNNLVASSSIWPKVRAELDMQGAVGERLPLRCEVHPHQLTDICKPGDFLQVWDGGCRLQCNADIACGHQCQRICHSEDREHESYKCLEIVTQVPPGCLLEHAAMSACHARLLPCLAAVDRELPCGHRAILPCHAEPAAARCVAAVAVEDSPCGHAFERECHAAEWHCPRPCGLVLACGHECVRQCHVDDDADHAKYVCREPCTRAVPGCHRGHGCPSPCFVDCRRCTVPIVKTLPRCGHQLNVPCGKARAQVVCTEQCQRPLPCGHGCTRGCGEECGGCQVKVEKPLSACGHHVLVGCEDTATAEHCQAECGRELACGHPCRLPCRLPCQPPARCVWPVAGAVLLVCGHAIDMPCNEVTTAVARPSTNVALLQLCAAPCATKLPCGHDCAGSCGACLQGRVHVLCQERCSRLLLCGHPCETACSEPCPPCSAKCEMRCQHARCPRKCGVPCVPCKAACERACVHGGCSRPCGQRCDRLPCEEPCPLLLSCGHACAGFCGEACPPRCDVCLPEGDVVLGAAGGGARLVLLVDCGHCVDAEAMLQFLADSEVKVPRCPRCSSGIAATQRYKNYVHRAVADVAQVKKRVLGQQDANKTNEWLLLERLKALKPSPVVRQLTREEDLLYESIAETVRRAKDRQHRRSDADIQTLRLKASVLIDIHASLGACECKELVACGGQLLRTVRMHSRLGRDQAADIALELMRFRRAHQLLRAVHNARGVMATKKTAGIEAPCTGSESLRPFTKLLARLLRLDKYSHVFDAKLANLLTTIEETRTTFDFNPIDMSQGQWVKCPDGHVNNVGNTADSKEQTCEECKAVVKNSFQNCAGLVEVEASSVDQQNDDHDNMASI